MALFCNPFCDRVSWCVGFASFMVCDNHWAVNEGRLDESPFYFMAMGGGR